MAQRPCKVLICVFQTFQICILLSLVNFPFVPRFVIFAFFAHKTCFQVYSRPDVLLLSNYRYQTREHSIAITQPYFLQYGQVKHFFLCVQKWNAIKWSHGNISEMNSCKRPLNCGPVTQTRTFLFGR